MITEYKVFGQTVTIKPKKNLHKKKWLGLWKQYENEILYQQNKEDYKICDEVLNHIVCHEIIHSWLDKAGYPKLSKDEKLVDLLGACLNEFLITKK